jgi:hypothetical protein
VVQRVNTCWLSNNSVLSTNEVSRVISFSRTDAEQNKTRINVYYTTGCVGTVLHHPNHEEKNTQLFRKDCTLQELQAIFNNPRVHTNKGYCTLRELKSREAQAAGRPPPKARGRGGRGRRGGGAGGGGGGGAAGDTGKAPAAPRAPRVQRGPRTGTSLTTCFIAKLPLTIDTPALLAAFRPYRALDAQVAISRRGDKDRSLGFGFVLFGNQGDQQKAIASMNGKNVSITRMCVCRM